MIKVVVWDLDGTVWPGVALESAPVPDPAVVSTLDILAGRGILLAVASRNPAEVGELVESLLPGRFVAAEYGWGRKSDALRRIADRLDVQLDTVAFVDDDPLERAEVERALAGVAVLAPDEVPDALGWPEFDPGPVTAAAASRVDSYRQRERRRSARAGFAGSEEDFLRWCGLRATVRAAAPGDAARLAELARRTTQYNSTGADWSAAGTSVVLELTDRFGDDGLVGMAVLAPPADPAGPAAADPGAAGPAAVDPGTGGAAAADPGAAGPAAVPAAVAPVAGAGPGEWTVPLVAVSCRAGGRGAVPVLLTAAARLAAARGAAALRVPCRLTERNVPVRLGLKQAGFAAAARAGDTAVYVRDLADPPAYPDWIEVTER